MDFLTRGGNITPKRLAQSALVRGLYSLRSNFVNASERSTLYLDLYVNERNYPKFANLCKNFKMFTRKGFCMLVYVMEL